MKSWMSFDHWSATFRNLRIGTRLALGFASITCLTILSVAACGWLMVQQDGQFSEVLDSSVPELTQLQQVSEEVAVVNLAARDALLAVDEATSKEALARIESGRTKIGQQIESLRVLLSSGNSKDRELAEQLSTHSSGVLVTLVKFSRLYSSNRLDKAKALFGHELQAKMLAVSQTIKAAQELELSELSQQKIHARERLTRSLELAALGLAAVVGLTALLAWRLSHSITEPLSQAVSVAQHVANGDLSTRIHINRQDEVGDLLAAMATMQNKLSALVTGIVQSVQNIESTSQELASGSDDMNHRTDQTVDTLRSTSAAMTELAQTFEESAKTAKMADELVCGASQGVTQSGAVVSRVVDSMQAISTSSSRIVDIIGVIDGIAFQTNILALNAAVEAARAGEQGRGFAVVASEVRALAQRSSNAAKEIKTLISDSAEKVQTGSQLVSQAGRQMGELVHQVGQVSDLIKTISQISAHQTEGVQNVHHSVSELGRATQLNAALVQQTSGAGMMLQEESHRLAQSIQAFRLA
jgi:methyl-accepting chemotaxis protein